MTARSYPDLSLASPRSVVRFTARSEANLQPRARYQSGFVYQVEDIARGRVLWERRQAAGEGSPVDAFVNDDGDVVLRTHFADWSTEHLLLIDHTGTKRLDVVISADASSTAPAIETVRRRDRRRRSRLGYEDVPTTLWHDAQIRTTTAGPMWTSGAFPTFPRNTSLFSLRTAWGRRIVIDMATATVVPDELQTDAIRNVIEAEERRRALEVLQDAVETPASPGSDLIGAFAVTIEQRVADAVPILRAHENWPAFVGGARSHVLGPEWAYQRALVRSLARLALRSVGAIPDDGGNYLFARSISREAEVQEVVELPATADACGRAATLPVGTDALSALRALGAPDHVEQIKLRVGRYYTWSETWEYDGPTGSTQLAWSFPGNPEVEEPRRLAAIDSLAGWTTTKRLLSMLFPF